MSIIVQGKTFNICTKLSRWWIVRRYIKTVLITFVMLGFVFIWEYFK